MPVALSRLDRGRTVCTQCTGTAFGDIALTDEVIRLSKNQDQMDSVMLHEMGHIVYRHSLNRVIESSLVTTVIIMVTGDSNGIADMGNGLGSLLLGSQYSRQHEAEAEQDAFNRMLEAGNPPHAFGVIIERMSTSMDRNDDTDLPNDHSTDGSLHDVQDKQDRMLDYLPSPPNTAERIEEAQSYSGAPTGMKEVGMGLFIDLS